MSSVISANRLFDGKVVYWAGPRLWVMDIQGARVLADKAAGEAALAEARLDEAANIVLESFVLAVSALDGVIRPLTLRDRIRHAGPSITYSPTGLHDVARAA
ncbi:MAG: DUF2849 domain-containing protein [Hyphomicrobiales bacterium]|nr:DUF2849 domain-containing protein [Hyphomicrobiales bacterium]MDE2114756.1 DUF2849 domain-containing protein [Hyphomicrobiales bacterium]